MKTSKKSKVTTFFADTLFNVIGAILYALSIYYFTSEAGFAPGGISGLAIIIHEFLPIPLGICTFALNIPIVIFCYRFLGKKFLIKSLISLGFFSITVDLLPKIIKTPYKGDSMMAALFAGLLLGMALAVVYSRGASTGGIDFIVFSVKKKFPELSVGLITLCVDGVIILLGGVVFGHVEAVLYGILMTAASATIMDKMMYGFGSGKMTMVITNMGDEIAKRIDEEVDRGSTIIKARGTFTGEERQMLLCACNKAEAITIKNIIKKTDPRAVIMLSTTDEVYGYGFKSLDEQ